MEAMNEGTPRNESSEHCNALDEFVQGESEEEDVFEAEEPKRILFTTANESAAENRRRASVTTRFSLSGLENERDKDLVSLEGVLRFVFPPSKRHPMSTGRLFAYGLYGPLNAKGELRAGVKGKHVVNEWELDVMCGQLEREDILNIYVFQGRPLAMLNKAQQDELISEADCRIKASTGRCLMPQLNRDDVIAIFAGLTRNSEGLIRFHDVQDAIVQYRDARIARLKIMYPDVRREKSIRHHTIANMGAVDREARESISGSTAAPSTARSRASSSRIGRPRVGPDVAPPEMFMRKTGLTPHGIASHTSKLLSVHASHICHIGQGTTSALTTNVRLIRHDQRSHHLAGRFTNAMPPIMDNVARHKFIATLRDHCRGVQFTGSLSDDYTKRTPPTLI